MVFLSLPDEVILEIASWLQSQQTLNALCRVNRRLNRIVERELYRFDALNSYPYSLAVTWAAARGITALLEKAFHYGAFAPVTVPTGVSTNFWDCKPHPLVLATVGGHREIVNVLIERGCSPHIRDPRDYSLLSIAVIGDQISLVQRFLALDVKQVAISSVNRFSPIHLAASRGNETIVQLLLSEHARSLNNLPSDEQMQNALEAALKAGHDHIVSRLLEHEVNLNFRFSQRDDNGRWHDPLEWAVEHGNLEQVNLFLAKGAIARTLFLEGVAKGMREDMVEALVQKIDRYNSTIGLCHAVDRQDYSIINILLGKGVDCNFEEPPDFSDDALLFHASYIDEHIPPLVRAVSQENLSLAQSLIAHGADVNAGYHKLDGSTSPRLPCGRVVQLAMYMRNYDLVHLLIASGADIYLGHPTIHFHDCPTLSRRVHLRITAGLREAVGRTK
jgi:ankyrin repeat protein